MSEKMTGYPSIDKPWEKFHREEPIKRFNVEQKFYELLIEANKDNMHGNAINYMGISGNTWTFHEIFEMSDKLAAAYQQAGIKEGDTVLIATMSGVEEALNLVALNKIGVISKWIDITATEEDIQEAIVSDNCEYIVAFAFVIPKIEKIINKTNVKKVLYVEPSQFIRKSKIIFSGWNAIKELVEIKKNAAKHDLPKNPKDDRYIRFDEFLKCGKADDVNYATYEKGKPVLKIQSSGTTGKPKVIVHTDYSINCSINKFSGTDLPLYVGNVLLKIAPSWVGYGLINSLAMGMAYGMEVLVTPSVDADLLSTMNGKYDVTFAVPYHYRYLAEHIDELSDMSRPVALISGGDKIAKSEVENFQVLFKSKGCSAPILNGAGSNEILGAGCVNPVKANKPGSIGIPMWKDIVSIFDPDTLEEKKYGEKGEICYQTEAAFLHYDNNESQTAEVKKEHKDGSVWIHTKDLGYMDEDGYIFIEGRLNRVITVGGFKISASMIEDAVQDCDYIKECVAVGVPDKESGEVPMLFIVLKENVKKENVQDEIERMCQNNIKGRAIPKYYEYIKEIPYTSNNKQDFRKLERMGKELVCPSND